MDAEPARLEPIFTPRIWGARSLAPIYPEMSQLAEPIGEAWLTAHESRFVNGPFAGETLAHAWKHMPAEWRGESAAGESEFPLLVKFLFPNDRLSVQVHPEDSYAQKNEIAAGGRGKTEMWYVVAAEHDAAVWIGLRSGVTRESFRRAIDEGSADELIERVPVRAGDAIYCPAGTVHYIGPGLTLCEIQEYSDITYRIFDFNRCDASGKPRALHLEKAFEVIRFDEPRGGKLQPVSVRVDGAEETYIVACRHFAVVRADFSSSFTIETTPAHFELQIVIEGHGKIEWGAAKFEYARGQAWFFPAGRERYHIHPSGHSRILRAYVPANREDFARNVDERSSAKALLSRLVHL
jgi:mannose-6-phosphate isomerase